MEPQMLTDPVVIGPGIWVTIHLKAKLATDIEGKENFIKEMYFHYHNFPCLNCRKHIQEYIDNNPFDYFYNLVNENGKEIGMFKWSWIFHNTVNKRLQKPYLDWKTACEMYKINDDFIEPCTNCGEEKIIDKTQIVQNYFLRKGVSETVSINNQYFY